MTWTLFATVRRFIKEDAKASAIVLHFSQLSIDFLFEFG